DLMTAFAWLADEAPLRGLIVTGAGRAFCAGGDINGFKAGVEDDTLDLPAQARRGADALRPALVLLRRIPYPVIAAVNGPAAGARLRRAARVEGGLVRLRLRPDRRIAGRRDDLLPSSGRRAEPGDGDPPQRSQPQRRRRPRRANRRRGRRTRRADGARPGKGR